MGKEEFGYQPGFFRNALYSLYAYYLVSISTVFQFRTDGAIIKLITYCFRTLVPIYFFMFWCNAYL